MTAKIRNLLYVPSTPAIGQSDLPNLLVAGCSYTWNNSEEHACTWPYYLVDSLGFNQVYDCSQSGSGPDLTFNSVINEILTCPTIQPDNTMIIVMWSELSRTDVITNLDRDIKNYHNMSLYQLNDFYCNFSIFNDTDSRDTLLDKLSYQYKRLVPFSAQQYQSLLKIIGLSAFLDKMKFKYMFISAWPVDQENLLKNHIPKKVIDNAINLFDPVMSLDHYAGLHQMRIPNDRHPTPDAHLKWTKEHLVPAIYKKFPNQIKIF
jgi:hypothetical protein